MFVRTKTAFTFILLSTVSDTVQSPLEWLLKQPLDSQLTVELKIKTTNSGDRNRLGSYHPFTT